MGVHDNLTSQKLLTRELCSILVSLESRNGMWVHSSALGTVGRWAIDGQKQTLLHAPHATSHRAVTSLVEPARRRGKQVVTAMDLHRCSPVVRA